MTGDESLPMTVVNSSCFAMLCIAHRHCTKALHIGNAFTGFYMLLYAFTHFSMLLRAFTCVVSWAAPRPRRRACLLLTFLELLILSEVNFGVSTSCDVIVMRRVAYPGFWKPLRPCLYEWVIGTFFEWVSLVLIGQSLLCPIFYWTIKTVTFSYSVGTFLAAPPSCRQNMFKVKAPNKSQEKKPVTTCSGSERDSPRLRRYLRHVEDAEMRDNFLEPGHWRSVRGNISRYQNQK